MILQNGFIDILWNQAYVFTHFFHILISTQMTPGCVLISSLSFNRTVHWGCIFQGAPVPLSCGVLCQTPLPCHRNSLNIHSKGMHYPGLQLDIRCLGPDLSLRFTRF